MEGIIPEQVIKTEEVRLSINEIRKLKHKQDKEFMRLLLPYLGITGVFIYALFVGPFLGGVDESGVDKTFLVIRIVLFLLLWAGLNIYFYYLHRRIVVPLSNDIKKGTKLILFLRLEKREPFFGRYFIFIPFSKRRQLEVSGEDYFRLKEDSVRLVIAPSSLVILQLMNGEEDLDFHLPL